MPRTVIFSKIASVILDMEKLEDCLSEDFLSILKTSEITLTSGRIGCLGRPVVCGRRHIHAKNEFIRTVRVFFGQ